MNGLLYDEGILDFCGVLSGFLVKGPLILELPVNEALLKSRMTFSP
jgi:hypothetical protein